MPEKKKSKAQLDAMAREAGYPSYEAWRGHYKNYQQKRTVQGSAPKKNFLQRLIEKIPGHPAQTLDYTRRKMEEATSKGNRR